MLGQSKRPKNVEDDATQPLLTTSQEDIVASERTVFAIEEESDEEGALRDTETTHNVRFDDNVQYITPSLRSTVSSRETEFDQDPDELDHDPTQQNDDYHDQTMPLLVGLIDSATARRSLDVSLPLHANGHEPSIDLEELAAKRTAGGGMLDSIANMANSILGAGIIGLPYAMSQAGLVTGLVLLVVLCIVTDWTIRLIVINAKMSGRNSYIDIMDQCFGSSGRAAVSLFQFAFAFGGMCAYGIIIGDSIPHVIRSVFPKLQTVPVISLLTNRQFVIALCTICVSYPLSLYRDIHKLSRASGFALVSMLIIVSAVLIKGPQVTPDLRGDASKRFSIIEPGVFQAIGVISFAFVCHHNSLLIYGSLRTPTLDRFAQVTHVSTIVSFICSCALAISAFLVFTDKTQGNILNNFPPNDTFINIARFCFGLNMFTTLPLELFVCREVIEQYFFPHESFSARRHLFFTTSILFSSMFLALLTCDLGVMLEITGGASATVLAFIFPPACFLKLTDPHTPWHSRAKLSAIVCTAFGITVMLITFVLAFQKMWTPRHDVKICI